nr:MAG TPA: hypothetical protein [Caudoviricetes sp.]
MKCHKFLPFLFSFSIFLYICQHSICVTVSFLTCAIL